MSRAVSPVSGRRSATSRLRARRTFRRRRIPLHAREILIEALDEPGALGELALVMAMAGINIDSVSVTTKGHVVVGVDDLAGATHMGREAWRS